MTTHLATLERITRHPTLHGSVLACANGALWHWFFKVENGKVVPTFSDTTAEAVCLSENPKYFIRVLHYYLHPNRIGGKHGPLRNVDENWPRIGEAVARMVYTHGGNASAEVVDYDGTHTTASLNGLCGRVFRHLQLFVVQSKRFPDCAAPCLFLDNEGVAATYDHAYLAPVWTFDDMGESWASMLAWFSKYHEATGNTRDRDWCLDQLKRYADAILMIDDRWGGIPQFVDSRTLYPVPGREHEPAFPERRATIWAAHSLLIAASMGVRRFLVDDVAMMLDRWWIDNERVVWWDGQPVGHGSMDDTWDGLYAVAHDTDIAYPDGTIGGNGIANDLAAARAALKAMGGGEA